MTTIFVNKIKNNQGGNPVQINELRGIDTAGSVNVRGEGSATTNLQQGLLKVWYGFDLYSSQNSFEGSFNVSSGTDDGTGDVTGTYTNNMSSQDYVASTSGPDNSLTNTQADNSDGNVSRLTTAYRSRQESYSGAAFDGIHYIHVAGDLA
tara:strand:- start:104 stop:553 length:450 start_codon:yes stop_codon:yes gene_type:complete